jgi:hypothetical protein
MPIIDRSYYGAAQRGRDDRQQEQTNALLNRARALDVNQGEYVNTLMRDKNTTAEQFARAGQTGIANSLSGMNADKAAQAREWAKQVRHAADYSSQAPPGQTKVFIERNFPFLVETYGPQWATASDDQVRQELQGIAAKFGAQADIGPAVPKERAYINTIGPDGRPVRGEDVPGAPVYVEPKKAPARFRPMRPDEIAASGLPPGTAAQVNDDTGAIQVLSKRDTSATLSQKDATTAKMKLTTVVLARKQLNAIKEAFEEGRSGVNAFGPGQALLPTQAGKKFDGRVDQMRSTLTALTRVPGVGAMSDYETKLDQSKFPSRGDYETVTADKLAQLDDMLNLIEGGYKDLLSGSAPQQQQNPAPQAPQQGPVRVNTPQEAMALPSGTQFVTPDGRVKVRP